MVIAIPLFILLMLIEFLVAKIKKKNLYGLSDTITNLNIGVGNQVVGLLYKGLILASLFWVYENFALFSIENTLLTGIICAIIYDFLFYWAHRWGHEVNLFWGAHVVHHQSEEYNLSVALRQSWFHSLLSFFIFLPLPLLGFDPVMIGIVAAISTFYQFWIHTKVIKKLPKIIELIFNTPSHHRVHHAVNPEYIDKNHGAILIIWDRLFGTFKEEVISPTYGTTTQFKSMNPAWANFDYYTSLLKEMKGLKFSQKIKMLFSKPGWTPNGPNPKDIIAQTNIDREKFDIQIPLGMQLYTLAQFGIIAWGLIAYISHFAELTFFYKILFAGMILFSITITGGILEKKKWVFFAEYARLLGAAFTISTFYYFQYIDWFTIMLVVAITGVVGFGIWFGAVLKTNYRSLLLN